MARAALPSPPRDIPTLPALAHLSPHLLPQRVPHSPLASWAQGPQQSSLHRRQAHPLPRTCHGALVPQPRPPWWLRAHKHHTDPAHLAWYGSSPLRRPPLWSSHWHQMPPARPGWYMPVPPPPQCAHPLTPSPPATATARQRLQVGLSCPQSLLGRLASRGHPVLVQMGLWHCMAGAPSLPRTSPYAGSPPSLERLGSNQAPGPLAVPWLTFARLLNPHPSSSPTRA